MVDRQISGVSATMKAEAFRRLASEHLDQSYRMAHAILGNRSEAEDATHDAFVQAWRKWSSLREVDRFEAWFGRILVNTCRDRLRRSARQPAQDLSEELAASGGNPYRQADDRQLIGSALADLSPDHRVVVALRYYRDLSTRQISQLLGIREGTVSSRLHYALHRLRLVLEESTPEEQAHD